MPKNLLIISSNQACITQFSDAIADSNETSLRSVESCDEALVVFSKTIPDILIVDVNACSDAVQYIRDMTLQQADSPRCIIAISADPSHVRMLLEAGAIDVIPADVERPTIQHALKLAVMRSEIICGAQRKAFDLQHQQTDLERTLTKLDDALKEKDEFLSICSHDIKAPLGVIKIGMDVLVDSGMVELSGAAAEIAGRVRRQADYCLQLVTDLLEIGSIEHGIKLSLTIFSIREFIDDCMANFQTLANEKDVSLSLAMQGDVTIEADRMRLTQVVNNILSNAIKYAPANTNIDIVVATRIGQRVVNIDSQYVTIAVRDHGPGIPKDKVETIFQKFTQARDSDKSIGTGLGLTIVREYCKAHHGSITVDSIEGKGATFTASFPIRDNEAGWLVPDKHSVIWVSCGQAADQEAEKQAEKSLDTLFVCDALADVAKIFKAHPKLSEHTVILIDMRQHRLNEEEAVALQKVLEARPGTHPILSLCSTAKPPTCPIARRISTDWINLDRLTKELPRHIKRALRTHRTKQFTTEFDVERHTILIVDDEDLPRKILERVAQQQNFNILTAKSGREALHLFQRYKVEVVVSDVVMKEMDGIELAQHIKQIAPEIPLVLCTAQNKDDFAYRIEDLGKNIFLMEKNADSASMKAIMSEAVALLR